MQQACLHDKHLFCPQAKKKRRQPHHIHQNDAVVTDIGRKPFAAVTDIGRMPSAAVTDIGRMPSAAVTDIGRMPSAAGGRARWMGEGAPTCAPARGGRGAP